MPNESVAICGHGLVNHSLALATPGLGLELMTLSTSMISSPVLSVPLGFVILHGQQ